MFTMQEAIYLLSRLSAGPRAAELAAQAWEQLEADGHTVSVQDRPGMLGDGPSCRVYVDGQQVA